MEGAVAAHHQILAVARCQTVVGGEADCSWWASVNALRTKQAATKVESQAIRAPINGLVQEVRIKEGDNVQYDDVMFLLGNLAD